MHVLHTQHAGAEPNSEQLQAVAKDGAETLSHREGGHARLHALEGVVRAGLEKVQQRVAALLGGPVHVRVPRGAGRVVI